jgi:pyridoxine/pyridoxamine 5'-phosphate oxidase
MTLEAKIQQTLGAWAFNQMRLEAANEELTAKLAECEKKVEVKKQKKDKPKPDKPKPVVS